MEALPKALLGQQIVGFLECRQAGTQKHEGTDQYGQDLLRPQVTIPTFLAFSMRVLRETMGSPNSFIFSSNLARLSSEVSCTGGMSGTSSKDASPSASPPSPALPAKLAEIIVAQASRVGLGHDIILASVQSSKQTIGCSGKSWGQGSVCSY